MLNIGIIGAGRIGKVHAESIQKFVKNGSVKMIADPFMTPEIETWAKGLGIEKCSKDYKDILNDKDIQAVLICSSTNTHAPISVEAAKAGKHIFCEKPIGTSLEEITEMLKIVKEAGIKFQVGLNRRFDNNFKAIKKAVVAGQIGEPHVIKVTSRDPQAPPPEYVKVSGGMFFDMTIHDFDMVRYLSGSEVVEVYAMGDVLINKDFKALGDIDTAIITMKLANGAMAVIDNSREAAYGYDQRAEVFGSKGAISISNNTESKAVLSNKDGVVSEKPLYFFLERYMQSFTSEMVEFIDAVKNNTPTPVTGDDGLKCILIGMAAKKSLAEGRPVKLSEIK
ncbi:MAG: inositol 2-dehydrogenase [Fusobacteriaceae bacterium]